MAEPLSLFDTLRWVQGERGRGGPLQYWAFLPCLGRAPPPWHEGNRRARPPQALPPSPDTSDQLANEIPASGALRGG